MYTILKFLGHFPEMVWKCIALGEKHKIAVEVNQLKVS